MSSSKKMTCKWTLRQLFICLRPPPLLGFCLGVLQQFCRFWIWSDTHSSVKLLQNMLSNTTNIPPPPRYTHCNRIYFLYTHICTYSHRKGGRVEPERRGEGNRGEFRSQSWFEYTNMTECTQETGYLQSINSVFELEKNASYHILEFRGWRWMDWPLPSSMKQIYNLQKWTCKKTRKGRPSTSWQFQVTPWADIFYNASIILSFILFFLYHPDKKNGRYNYRKIYEYH